MRTSAIALVSFALLFACKEENPQPVSPFAGSYKMTSEDRTIEIGFTVSEDGQIHNFGNDVYVKHPAIPVEIQRTNNITPFDQFKGGYGRIEIVSRTQFYYRITLIYNRFIEGGMSVYDVQIDITGEPFTILPDQVFTKGL